MTSSNSKPSDLGATSSESGAWVGGRRRGLRAEARYGRLRRNGLFCWPFSAPGGQQPHYQDACQQEGKG